MLEELASPKSIRRDHLGLLGKSFVLVKIIFSDVHSVRYLETFPGVDAFFSSFKARRVHKDPFVSFYLTQETCVLKCC